jgi:hypothetical protein
LLYEIVASLFKPIFREAALITLASQLWETSSESSREEKMKDDPKEEDGDNGSLENETDESADWGL